MDNIAERKDEERIEAKQAIDREDRGVILCPNCGFETPAAVYCGNSECGFCGCPDCMVFDESFHTWFCSKECLMKWYIHKMLMQILDYGSKDLTKTLGIIRETLERVDKIK